MTAEYKLPNGGWATALIAVSLLTCLGRDMEKESAYPILNT
jgi:hypothetical protein